MAFPSVTYTFANSTTADATQVNQNFTDLINGASDATKSYSISAITASGTATLSGNVVFGTSASNTITFNGVMSTDLLMGLDNTYNFGGATVGVKSVYFGNTAKTVRVMAPGSIGSSWTLTLPTSGGTNTYVLSTDGSGTTAWTAPALSYDAAVNYSLAAVASANVLTITLNNSAGSAPTAGSPATFNFRNATLTTGTPTAANVTSAITIAINQNATLGLAASQNQYVHVYLQLNGGTPELCVAGNKIFDEARQYTSTAITAGSTDQNTLYSTTGRAAQSVRYLGRLLVNESSFWASSPTEIAIAQPTYLPRTLIRLHTSNGWGSSSTQIRKFTTVVYNFGPDITYPGVSATLGEVFTIVTDGVYAISYTDNFSGTDDFGISLNSTQLTTAITSITTADRLALMRSDAGGSVYRQCCWTGFLKAGDVIRPHGDGGGDGTAARSTFTIAKVSH